MDRLELSAFQQECVQDGIVSYRVQAKKPELTLHALLNVPAYDTPQKSHHVIQRRQQLVNIAHALIGGGGYLPAIIEVGHRATLHKLAPQFTKNEPYILLEQPIGVLLSRISKAFSQEDAATVIIRIGYGVKALHDLGWVHGALTPEKIYVSVDRALGTLAQFGTVMPECNGKVLVTPHLIQHQNAHFSAPEIHFKKKVDKTIDIYALGLLLYHLLVGSLPRPISLKKTSILTRFFNQLVTEPNPLQSRFPKIKTISQKWRAVIEKSTALNPKHRYRHVSEFIEAVGKAVGWSAAKFLPEKTIQKGLLSQGDRLGNYTIKGVFASGNQGVIYDAVRTETGFPNIPVLIKCSQYNYNACQDVGAYIFEKRIQIKHEAQMSQRLHRFLGITPQLIDFFYDQTHDPVIKARAPSLLNNEPYLVMSKISAHNLGNINHAEQDFAIRIGRRLAETLVAVHARKVLYQDIKPENILVDPWASTVFIVDLGAVCPVINGKLQENSPAYGNVTPGYQAPEFDELWQDTDYRFDIYSLGATLFFLLTGICPLHDLYKPKFQSIEKTRTCLGTRTLKDNIRNAERPCLDINALPVLVRPVIAQLLERDRHYRCQDAPTAVKILKRLERQLLGYPIQAPIILDTFPDTVTFKCQIPQDCAITHLILKRIIGNTQTTVLRMPYDNASSIILRDPNPVPGIILYQLSTETELDQIICVTVSKTITYTPALQVELIEKPGAILIRWHPIVSAKNYIVLRHPQEIPKTIKDGIQIASLINKACIIEDKTVNPNQTYYYSVIAEYPDNLYSPPAGGVATPRLLPVSPEFVAWHSENNSHCVLQWHQKKPLPDDYVIKEYDRLQKELGTFECKAQDVFHYRVNTQPGEQREIHMASRTLDVYSAWQVIWVAGYVSVIDLHAEPEQAERAVLHWTSVPGVLYQIERKNNDSWQQIAQLEQDSFDDKNIIPGEYQYKIQALVSLNNQHYEYFGHAHITVRVLKAVPLPDVQISLHHNILNISWQPPAIQILCKTQHDTLYTGTFEHSDHLKLTLAIGLPVTLQIWGKCGKRISSHPLQKILVPTMPVKDLHVEVLIEKTKLYWENPDNTLYCIIFRQTELGTTTVCERCHKNFFIDTTVSSDIKISYTVKPVFQNGVIGDAQVTSTLIVPPEPQMPQNIHWLQQEKCLCFKWQLPSDMRYIAAWQVITSYQHVENTEEVSRHTTILTINALPYWLPIQIQVRAIVGTQIGHKVVQCVGGLTEKIGVTITAGIQQVNMYWKSPPLSGKLLITRACGEKKSQLICRADKQSYCDTPLKMDITYLYSYHFELKHPHIGTLTTSVLSQKVIPRSIPINTKGAKVTLREDGQHVHLRWADEIKTPSVDRYLYLRKMGTKTFSNEREDNVTILKAPHIDYIPELGLTCQYARLALNNLTSKISPIVSITSIPQARIESIQGETALVITVKKLPIWQVLLRKQSSEKIRVALDSNNLQVLLKNLQAEGGIQLLAPELTTFYDLATEKTFHYHIFSLVIRSEKCYLSKPPQHVPIQKGSQALPTALNLWVAQQWFATNRYLITTNILECYDTELEVHILKQGKVKVFIPGDGDLLFIPKSYKKRPIVQVFRTRSWKLRQCIVTIFCDEEPWLNIAGTSMARILEA